MKLRGVEITHLHLYSRWERGYVAVTISTGRRFHVLTLGFLAVAWWTGEGA